MAKTKKPAPAAETNLQNSIKAIRNKAKDRDFSDSEKKQLEDLKKQLGGLRFMRLATKRVPVAVAKIKNVAALAGKSYSCTQAQADYIIGAMESAVKEMKSAFSGGTKSSNAFQLPQA